MGKPPRREKPVGAPSLPHDGVARSLVTPPGRLPGRHRPLGRAATALLVVGSAILLSGRAWAEPGAASPAATPSPSRPAGPPTARRARPLPADGDLAAVGAPSPLDGTYLTLGPVAAATTLDGRWTSAVGLEVSLVQVIERRLPAALGLAAGGVSYADARGGRVWVEAEVAVAEPLPVPIGVGLGVAAEVDRTAPPRFGVAGTLWWFVGLVPYVRLGTVESSGGYVELGVMIKLPVRL